MQPARFFWVSLLFLTAARCGGDTITNESAGWLNGQAFTVPYAVAMYSSDPQDANTPGLVVFLSSSDAICALQQAGHMPKSSTLGQLLLQTASNGNVLVPTAPAMFAASPAPVAGMVANGNYATFGAAQLSGNDTCFTSGTTFSVATSGTVVVTDIGSRTTETQGSYNFLLDGNNNIQGTFAAHPCIVPESIWASGDAPTCE